VPEILGVEWTLIADAFLSFEPERNATDGRGRGRGADRDIRIPQITLSPKSAPSACPIASQDVGAGRARLAETELTERASCTSGMWVARTSTRELPDALHRGPFRPGWTENVGSWASQGGGRLNEREGFFTAPPPRSPRDDAGIC